jgi:hypothetical protein
MENVGLARTYADVVMVVVAVQREPVSPQYSLLKSKKQGRTAHIAFLPAFRVQITQGNWTLKVLFPTRITGGFFGLSRGAQERKGCKLTRHSSLAAYSALGRSSISLTAHQI